MKLSGIYSIDKAVMIELDAELSTASKAINAVPGISSGPMGLTPDHVKQTQAYQVANAAWERAKAAEWAFRKPFMKLHRKAWDADCRLAAQARREARLASLNAS